MQKAHGHMYVWVHLYEISPLVSLLSLTPSVDTIGTNL